MKNVNHILRLAAKDGDEELIKEILCNPQCNPKDVNCRGETALIKAAFYGQSSCVQLLLPVSNVLTKDNDGWTALMWAAARGHALCVQSLLPVSDVFAKNKSGKTASEMASACGYHELKSLINAYALARSELEKLQSFTLPVNATKPRSLRV